MADKKRLAELVHNGVSANRAGPQIAVCHRPQGGFTEWEKSKVSRISAPLMAGAQARTVRLHEMLHANHSPFRRSRKFHELTIQAVEDARVHALYWPKAKLPLRANRDCMSTALLDLRKIRQFDLADDHEWNLSMLIALRSLAMAQKIGATTNGAYRRFEEFFAETFPFAIREALQGVLHCIKKRSQASELFQSLLRLPPVEDGGDIGAASSAETTGAPMQVVRLPLVEPSRSAIPLVKLARSGAVLNRARIVNAVIARSTVGLFRRRRHCEGGTILLDASGSMGVSETRLAAICRAIPLATVAYYSGWGKPDSDGAFGALVIFGERGLRAIDAPIAGGGNDVDLFAIQWLLSQPGPRILVTDGEFCGGPVGQDVNASQLLLSAQSLGQLSWLRSFDKLAENLGLSK